MTSTACTLMPIARRTDTVAGIRFPRRGRPATEVGPGAGARTRCLTDGRSADGAGVAARGLNPGVAGAIPCAQFIGCRINLRPRLRLLQLEAA